MSAVYSSLMRHSRLWQSADRFTFSCLGLNSYTVSTLFYRWV